MFSIGLGPAELGIIVGVLVILSVPVILVIALLMHLSKKSKIRAEAQKDGE